MALMTNACRRRFGKAPPTVYLTHLTAKRDGSDAKVPQQQRHPLCTVAGAAENNEGVACQLVQDRHQITVLPHTRTKHNSVSWEKLNKSSLIYTNDECHLVLGWYEDVILLQFIDCRVFGGNGTLDRVFQCGSL